MRSKQSARFEDFYGELEAEAQAEGAAAIRDLRAKEFKYALINTLVTRRRDLNLTQENLAARSGVAQTEISRIERGRKSPTMDTFSRLASALAIDFWPEADIRSRVAAVTKGPRTRASNVRVARRPAARSRASSV